MKIGKRIRKIRKLLNYTQPQLATLADVSERTIRGMESCKPDYEFTLYTLRKVLAILGFQVEFKRTKLHLRQFMWTTNTPVGFVCEAPEKYVRFIPNVTADSADTLTLSITGEPMYA